MLCGVPLHRRIAEGGKKKGSIGRNGGNSKLAAEKRYAAGLNCGPKLEKRNKGAQNTEKKKKGESWKKVEQMLR